jgi:hypothetical protein
MCEVCAIFGAGEHWSDFSWLRASRFPFGELQQYRAERKRRLAVLNDLLAPIHLAVEDWDGEMMALVDREGRTLLVPSLTELWDGVKTLSGRRTDPLVDGFFGEARHE